MTSMSTLRAEIVRNSYVCEGTAADSLFTLCRALIERGHDPATALEGYRGEMLCLKVRSLGEGARQRVSPRGIGFVPGASPVADHVPGDVGRPRQGKAHRQAPRSPLAASL